MTPKKLVYFKSEVGILVANGKQDCLILDVDRIRSFSTRSRFESWGRRSAEERIINTFFLLKIELKDKLYI